MDDTRDMAARMLYPDRGHDIARWIAERERAAFAAGAACQTKQLSEDTRSTQ